MQETETLIVGAGLSGLHTAAALHSMGRTFMLIEARSRLGGRILSHTIGSASFDLGPAWFWPGQPQMDRIIDEFALRTFPQQSEGVALYEDESGRIQNMRDSPMEGAYRIEGGMSAIISALAERIPAAHILLNSTVTHLRKTNSGIETSVRCDGHTQTILSQRVILSLPPRLVAALSFEPALTPEQIATLQEIPTWMAGHAKFLAFYDTPLWRAAGYSGEAFSQRGPLMEIHDASPKSGGPYALFGFVGTPPDQRKALGEKLVEVILEQLQSHFGAAARHPTAYHLKDWAHDSYTATERDLTPLNYHPSYGYFSEAFDLWDGALLLSGTETAGQYGGFIEGALDASVRTIRKFV